jgi:hypothetical protein
MIGIYCGRNSSYLLNSKFELFACGSNWSGQLCLDSSDLRIPFFTKIDLQFTNKPQVFVGCTNHSIFIKDGNKVFACGENNSGMLSIGNRTQMNSPV